MHLASSSKRAAYMHAPSILTIAFIEWGICCGGESHVDISRLTSSPKGCLEWLYSAMVALSWASELNLYMTRAHALVYS